MANVGHSLVTDNLFTTPALAKTLRELGCDLTGTVRRNTRGIPAAAKRVRLQQGQAKFFMKGHTMFCVWKDRRPRPVLFLSTAVGRGMERRASTRGRQSTKPKVAYFYNKGMGGVDLGDQKAYSYADERRQVRIILIKFVFQSEA